MRNIRLTIEYDGTNYCGWQVQKRSQKKSIQGTIEKALQKILQEKIRIIGSGRTDAGVHAQAQVANFKTNSDTALDKLQKGLNALLPDDIAVTKIKEVHPDFHSRFAAKSKVYRYSILNRPYRSALLRGKVYFCPYPLDVRLMQEESRILLGKHNFKAFQAADKKAANSVRTIKKLQVKRDNDLIYIDIEADSFLYNMARNIIGTLLEIGRGKLPKGSLGRILVARDRRLAGPTVPSKGLCLLEVKYK